MLQSSNHENRQSAVSSFSPMRLSLHWVPASNIILYEARRNISPSPGSTSRSEQSHLLSASPQLFHGHMRLGSKTVSTEYPVLICVHVFGRCEVLPDKREQTIQKISRGFRQEHDEAFTHDLTASGFCRASGARSSVDNASVLQPAPGHGAISA